MVDKAKLSKIKNVFGESHKLYFEDIKPVEVSTDGQIVDINSHFVAISWGSTGGGTVAILDPLNPIRVPLNVPSIRGHTAPVVDVKWSPFKSNILATASEDATIKIWDIPQDGLKEDLKTETQTLNGHLKKVAMVQWHPSVFELLVSGGFDNKINIWNILNNDPLYSFSFAESLMSVEWNALGSLIALSTKDKNIHVVDPRINKSDVSFKGHDSAKNSKVCWVDHDQLVTVGYGKSNDRQIKLWDLKNTTKEVQTLSIDTQSGQIQPFFDIDTGLIFVPGRGEGNIKYYEYAQGGLKSIGEYKSGTSQKSVCFFPKRAMNYNKCEVARIGKLTSSTLEYVSFYIPKRVEGFHAEIYPDCISGEVNTTIEEWKSGVNKETTRKPINTLDNKFTASESSFEKKTTVSEEPRGSVTNELTNELNSLRVKCEELGNTVTDLRNQLELNVKHNYESSEKPVHQESPEVNTFRVRCEELEHTVDELRSELNSSKKINHELQEKIVHLESQVAK